MSADALESSHPSLLKNRSFHLLWLATFMAGFGDRLAMFAVQRLEGFASGSDETASLAAGTDLFFFLPYVFWGPLAGWLGDRFSRKWISVTANALRGVVVLAAVFVLPVSASGVLDVDHRWMGWVLMLLVGVFAATFAPVKMSMVPNVVGYFELQRANAVVVNIGVIGNLVGAAIGPRIAGDSLLGSVATSAGAFLIAGGLLVFLRPQPAASHDGAATAEGQRHGGGVIAGVRYVLWHHPVLSLIFLSMLIWGGTSVYLPALAALATGPYEGTQATFGLLKAALGGGILIAGIILGVANTRVGSEFPIAFGLLGGGVALLLQPFTPNLATGIVVAVFGGLSAGAVLVALNTLMLRITPNYIRSRVFGAAEMLSESSKVATSAAVWVLPHANDYMLPLTVGLGGLMLLAGVWAMYRYVLSGIAPGLMLNLIWRFCRFYVEAVHRLKVVGKARVPHSGPVLLVSNHTAGIDPLLIQASTMRVVRWMMAAEYRKPYFNVLWRRVPPILVRRGMRDAASLKAAVDVLKRGGILGIFPEGGINRERGTLRPFSPGVGLLAQVSGAAVVPVHISGTPQTQSTFGSFAMPSRSRLVFGEPFTVPRELEREEGTALIRRRLEELGRVGGS